MQFIDIPTELTTAFTDLILAAVSLYAVAMLRIRSGDFSISQKPRIWMAAFTALAIAGLLGFFAHGFVMSERLNSALWQPLYLSLGITVAFFAAGVLIDMRRRRLPAGVIIALVIVASVFYGFTLVVPGSFLVFIAYEAMAMLFALTVYLVIAVRRGGAWTWFMTLGIFFSIAAAVIQATGSLSVTLIWEFDHNGIFHLVQIPGVFFLLAGIMASRERR